MPNVEVRQLKAAVNNIVNQLPASIDKSTTKKIEDYFDSLPNEIDLTDGQKEIVEMRRTNFETLPSLKLSDLNPTTLKRLEQFSELITSEPTCHIIKAITKLYLVFLEKWNPELMNCGKKLQEAFNELTKPVKTLPAPSSRAIARERFQLLLLELLNEPRNAVYKSLNEKKKPIDKWFTDVNLDQMAALRDETKMQDQRSATKKKKGFLQEFRESLAEIALNYGFETNDFISLLKYKNCRAYDDTRKYALDIEKFITQNRKSSEPLFEVFLLEYIQMTEDDLKKSFAPEVKKFTKLFNAYCSSISDKQEEQNLQQEINVLVSSLQTVLITDSSPVMIVGDIKHLTGSEEILNPTCADGRRHRTYTDVEVSSTSNLEPLGETTTDSTMVKPTNEYEKQIDHHTGIRNGKRDQLKSDIHEIKLRLLMIFRLQKEIITIPESDYLHHVEKTKIRFFHSQSVDWYTTICGKCNTNCHENCMLNETDDTFGCEVIQKDDASCNYCTQFCGYSDHYHDKKRIQRVSKSMKEAMLDIGLGVDNDKITDGYLILIRALKNYLDNIKVKVVNFVNEENNIDIVDEIIFTLQQLRIEIDQLQDSKEKIKYQRLIDQLQSYLKQRNYIAQPIKTDSKQSQSAAGKVAKQGHDEKKPDSNDFKTQTTSNLVKFFKKIEKVNESNTSDVVQDLILKGIRIELTNRIEGLSTGPLKNDEEKLLQKYINICQTMFDYRLANRKYQLNKEIYLASSGDRFLEIENVPRDKLIELFAVRRALQNLGKDSMKSNSILIHNLPENITEDELMKKIIDLFENKAGKIKVDPITKRPAVYLFLDKNKLNGKAQITFENNQGAVLRAINNCDGQKITELNDSLISIDQCADHVDDEETYYLGKGIELNRLKEQPVPKNSIEFNFSSNYIPSLCSNDVDTLLLSKDENTLVLLNLSTTPFTTTEIQSLPKPILYTCWCDKQGLFFMLTEENIYVLPSTSTLTMQFSQGNGFLALTCSDDKLYVVQNFTTILEYDLISKSPFAVKSQWNVCEKDDDRLTSIAYHNGNGLIGLTIAKSKSEISHFEIRDPRLMMKIINFVQLSTELNAKYHRCIPLPADEWLIVGTNGSLLQLNHQGKFQNNFKYTEEVLNATMYNKNRNLAICTPNGIILHNVV